MTRFVPDTLFSDCWSSVGNVTYYHRNGVCYFRSKAYSEFAGTAEQLEQKGIYKESIHLERFFRNLLMGEDNVLMNRYLHVKAKELLDGGGTHTSTHTNTHTNTHTSTHLSFIPDNDNIKRLVEAIGERQLSVKEMLEAVGLKNRPNFIEYSLSPAMSEGYVRMLYPDSPRHPRQKYLLTVKGLAAYKEIKG